MARMLAIGVLTAAVLASATSAAQLKGAKSPGPVTADLFNDAVPKGKKVVPKRGGTVTMSTLAFSRTWEPDFDNATVVSEVVENYIIEPLVDFNRETWELVPCLAERWEIDDLVILKKGDERLIGRLDAAGGSIEVRPDPAKADYAAPRALAAADVKEIRRGSVTTFYIRPGVKFHNGMDLTVKDVEWTLKLLTSPHNVMPTVQSYLSKITSIERVGERAIRTIYGEQYFMALHSVGGLPRIRPWQAWDPEGVLFKDEKKYFEKYDANPMLLTPIGTGPYKMGRYVKDYSVSLDRYEGYWDKSKPQWPNTIAFRAINDPVAQLKALEGGEVDYIVQSTPAAWEDWFKDNPARQAKFGQVEIIYTAYYYIGWNCTSEIFKDKRVRWAMAHGAVDLDRHIKEQLRGRAERVTGHFYQYGPGHNPDLKFIPYDPKKAAELLEEAGWYDSDGDGVLDKDGKPFAFSLLHRTMPETNPAWQRALIVKENLRKLGIQMEIKAMDWGSMLEQVEKGSFEATTLGWGASSPPYPSDAYQIWHSSQIGERGSNHIFYRNPKVDKLIEDRRRELDPKRGQKLEWEFEKAVYDDQPYLWLFMPAELQAYNKKWRGVKFYVPRPGRWLNEWHQFDLVNE